MEENYSSNSRFDVPAEPLYLSIPRHPDIILLCHDPDRYPAQLLQELVGQLEEWFTQKRLSETPTLTPVITPARVKELLRCIHSTQAMRDHPITALYTAIGVEQREVYLAQLLKNSIITLERSSTTATPDLRGTILRMRYIDRMRSKTAMRLLNLSESHFHRLQAAGLDYIAHRLTSSLKDPQIVIPTDTTR